MANVDRIALVLAGSLALEPFVARAEKFFADDPVWKDDDRLLIPKPRTIERSGLYDLLFHSFFGVPSSDVPPAENVNTLGEVPDSSWFTNRMGIRELSREELVRGPNAQPPPDRSSPLRVVSVKTEGRSPGFTVVDGRDDTFLIKFDPVGYPQLSTSAEVIATKFFHAFGYHVPENHLLFLEARELEPSPEGTIDEAGGTRPLRAEDIDSVLSRVGRRPDETYPVLASRYLTGAPLGPFAYHGTRSDDPNDIFAHENRRELRGLRLFSAWLEHHDSRSMNTLDMYIAQVAARQMGAETLLPSLELSLQGEGFFSNSLPRNAISWSSADRPLMREIEPRAVFDRMFRPPSGGATRRSVMDAVLEDARSLSSYVSAADRHRLDEYFESIRALEKRIEFAERRSDALRDDQAKTDTRATPTPGIPPDHQEYMRLMMDLMVAAFQSDATRVCTFMLDHGQSNRYFDFIPHVRGTWHALSHYKNASGRTQDDDGVTSWDSVEQKRTMFAEVIRWHHEQVAYLLGRLKSIREPDGGTLLDNSMIVYGASLGDGNEHDEHDLPTLLLGRGAGSIRSGRLIEYSEPTNLANLHLSLLQRPGLEIDEFATSTGPLDELGG